MSNTTDEITSLVRNTLALADGDEVRPEHLLFYDLDFTSIDMVDLLFRIEEELGVTINEQTILELARGDMAAEEFSVDGVCTPAGRERLMELLPDTPPDVFPESIHTQTFPRYCTVGALARLVDMRSAAG